MRKILWILCLGGLCVAAAGCTLPEGGTILSPSYWARHAGKLANDFHEFRLDVDRTIFHLEDRPVEEH